MTKETTTIGVWGTSIEGFAERAVGATDDSSRFEFINLNPPTDVEQKCVEGSYRAKLSKWIGLFKKIQSVDVVIVVFVGNRSAWVSRVAHHFKKKVIYYWIGSDVYELINGGNKDHIKDLDADLHLAAADNLIEELASCGIYSKLQIFSPDLPLDIAEMPKEHAVLLSLPDSNHLFYGYNDLIRLIQEFPETPFYVVRTEKPELYNEPNVVFAGNLNREEMNQIFDRVSISIRFPEHDAWSIISSEAMIKGKTVISKFFFPGAIQASDYNELRIALRNVLLAPPVCNISGREKIIEMFDLRESGKTWVRYIDEVIGMKTKDGETPNRRK